MRAINRNQFALLLNEQNQPNVGRRTSNVISSLPSSSRYLYGLFLPMEMISIIVVVVSVVPIGPSWHSTAQIHRETFKRQIVTFLWWIGPVENGKAISTLPSIGYLYSFSRWLYWLRKMCVYTPSIVMASERMNEWDVENGERDERVLIWFLLSSPGPESGYAIEFIHLWKITFQMM